MYNLGLTPSPAPFRSPTMAEKQLAANNIYASQGMTPAQIQARQMMTTMAQPPAQPNVFQTAGGAYNSAVGMAGSVPQVRAQNITAGQLSTTNLNPYMNPFTQSVTNNVLGDLDRQRLIAMNGTDAAASGAFGGSRHGVMQAETNRGFADASAAASAGLNQANFAQAQGAAFQDIGNRLQADTSNQAAGLQASLANASNRLQSASTFDNLSSLGFGLGNNALAAQGAAGAQQQGLQQTLMDRGRAQFGGMTGQQDEALSRLLAVLGGVPKPVSSTQQEKPGLLGMLTSFL